MLGRLFRRPRRKPERPGPDPALVSMAASEIRQHAEAHATLFERAERLSEKAVRLERGGTPSESAGNRAGRARREVEVGLAALRASFVGSEGAEVGRVFDREVARMYPDLGLDASRADA